MSEAERESFHAPLYEHLGMAVIVADLDMNIRTWNAAAARTFGAAADRMIGTPILQIIPQERRATAEVMLRKAVDTGETFLFEFQHRDAQGESREFAATIAPLLSSDGTRSGTSVCVRDITKRIGLQKKVLEDRKMVALGEMAGTIAHHFNNILGGIVTSIDFAMASGQEHIKDQVLEKTARALQRATRLVNGLAAFAEGDRRAEDMGDLTEAVNQVTTEAEGSIARRGIKLVLNVPKLPVIPVPKSQVETILRQIVRNAIDAMPGGGTLTIEVAVTDGTARIGISDTGIGLDELAQSRVFEPFWTTKGDLGLGTGQPTGLGLAIAHGIAQMLGGSIRLTSTVGKGSKFTVVLPLRGEPEA